MDCPQINLVTVHVDIIKGIMHDDKKDKPQQKMLKITSCEDLKRAYPNQFDKMGNFKGPAKLVLKDDAEPFIDPPRKCSIHIKDKLQEELNKLVEQDVLRKVEQHTDWCSSLACSTKKDGSLRICLDPQKLNSSLKRCPHKIPTVEELNPKFANTKLFSKLDAKAGYWSIHLDADNISHSIWQILLETSAFWSKCVTRFLSGQDGPDPRGAPRRDMYS